MGTFSVSSMEDLSTTFFALIKAFVAAVPTYKKIEIWDFGLIKSITGERNE